MVSTLYTCSIRVIRNPTGVFGHELVFMHTMLSMFGKVLVHAWSWSRGLNATHSISVHQLEEDSIFLQI